MSEFLEQKSDSHCIFDSGDGWFALPTVNVREVVAHPSPAAIPRSSPMLAGLCHTGSEFLPVLRLSETGQDRHAKAQMLILDGPNGNWGLLVENVASVESLERSSDGESCRDEWSTAVVGISTFRDRIVRVLDADGLYRLAEEVLHQYWSSEGLTIDNPTYNTKGTSK